MPTDRRLNWSIVDNEDMPTYLMSGIIEVDEGLEELAKQITKPVRLNLEGISRISSTGVGAWLRFFESIEDKGPHRLSRCSVPFVAQLNMIDNLKGNAIVESVVAPFYCKSCDSEETALVEIRDKIPQLPKPACSECESEMVLDELESRYFFFLSY